jgi:PhzF family phenazine biosynthesis protein
MTGLQFRLVDVFAAEPLSGNGLTVVITDRPLDAALMQRLTQELRQFETIFLTPTHDPAQFDARVFTMEEELDFAGHPIIGAAAVLHERYAGEARARWTIRLKSQSVSVESRREDDRFALTMRQIPGQVLATIEESSEAEFLAAFGLAAEDRDSSLPMEVRTTGLPYLILPIMPSALERASIKVTDIEQRLSRVGAKFAYLFDARNREGRTWDNAGAVEDIATGSAAGPAAAFLVGHGLAEAGEEIILRQGRFVGRPSEMRLTVAAEGILLSGDVRMVARGEFDSSVAVQD